MQVTETVSEGLKRELKVVVPAIALRSKVEHKLGDIQSKVRLNGFRPGKVPLERIRQMYGRSVMAEVVEETVGETSSQAIKDRQERPAFQPNIKLPEDKESVELIIEGKADLEYVMSFEILPKVELADLKGVSLEKLVAKPSEEDMTNALDRLLQSSTSYEAKDGPAAQGDRLIIDFAGSIDDVLFEGGSAEDADIVIGAGRFIPGFEEGLEGAKAGEKRDIKVTFPADYQATHLAGKEASFAITVKEVGAPAAAKATDEFAKTLGMESLEKLNDAIRDQLQKDLDGATRTLLKNELLEALDTRHAFEVPPTLVTAEFEGIWRNVNRQLEQTKSTFEAQGTTEEKAREEYLKAAERRVRLGLVLAEIGTANEIRITDEELRRAMIDRARQFPGQERQVIEFYRKNPQALNELRAPVYEEKVISFALELVKSDEKTIDGLELMKKVAEQRQKDSIFEAHDDDQAHAHEHHHHDHEHGEGCGPDCGHDHDDGHHHHHHD